MINTSSSSSSFFCCCFIVCKWPTLVAAHCCSPNNGKAHDAHSYLPSHPWAQGCSSWYVCCNTHIDTYRYAKKYHHTNAANGKMHNSLFTFFSGTRSRVNFSNDVFYVGSSEYVTCSSDLDVTSIEWLYEGAVVASSSTGSVQLTFDPVTETIHQRVYICRISTVHNGIVEYNATIFVTSEYQ